MVFSPRAGDAQEVGQVLIRSQFSRPNLAYLFLKIVLPLLDQLVVIVLNSSTVILHCPYNLVSSSCKLRTVSSSKIKIKVLL